MLSESREMGSSLLFALREELDRWVGQVRGGNGTWSPATDMYPEEGELLIEVEMPGVEPGDVEILTEEQTLTVRGTSAEPLTPRSAHLMERRRGTYERVFTIPAEWDAGSAHASLSSGVLSLRVPPAPEPEGARRIELEILQASHRPGPDLLISASNGNARPAAAPAFLMPTVIGGSVDAEEA